MAFGNRANEGYGLGLVRSTSFGRKRVALSSACLDFGDEDGCVPMTPLKRQCSVDSFPRVEKSALEDLPQEILVRVLCGVEHGDLKSLFLVSKTITEATLIAKKLHFEYSTPKKALSFPKVDDFDHFSEIEPPNAPKQKRVPRSRLTAKKLADISVELFGSANE